MQLTAAERRQIQRRLHHPKDSAPYRRAFALLQVEQGKSLATVAAIIGVSRNTVFFWVKRFRHAPSLKSFLDRARARRTSRWTDELHDVLRTALAQSPKEFDYESDHWDVGLLQVHLFWRSGRWVSKDCIRHQLHRIGRAAKHARQASPRKHRK